MKRLSLPRPVLLVLVLVIYAQSYQGRIAVVHAQLQGCERGIADRRDEISKDQATITGNEAVAADPTQSASTRTARSLEAVIERAAVADLESRLPPPRGQLVCSRVYPIPSPLPHL